MNRERFEILAEAYGSEITRWPANVRAAAVELAASDAAWTSRVLDEAAMLDGVLAAPRVTVPADLIGRVLAAAPSRRVFAGWPRWLAPAGLAAACAAGTILGAQVPRIAATDNGDAVVAAVADDEDSLYLDEEA